MALNYLEIYFEFIQQGNVINSITLEVYEYIGLHLLFW